MPRYEDYHYGDDHYQKRYLDDGQIVFTKNGQALSLETWNYEVNQRQSQDIKDQHRNPIISLLEGHRRRSLVRFVAAQPGDHIADVGCETGFIAAMLAPQAGHVTCIDIDPAMLEIARQRIQAENVDFRAGNVEALSLDDAQFEVVLASEILEHVPDIRAALGELVRVTRPGGRIILSLPNDALIVRAKQTLRRLGLGWMLGGLTSNIALGHVGVYNRASLRAILQEMPGIHIQRLRYNPPFFLNIYAQVEKR